MLVIIDYGLGNLASISNMFRKLGERAIISSSVKDIEQANKLILPGVGHFETGMSNLRGSGLDQVLKQKVQSGNTPLLGICLGMQLLTSHSEEGQVDGLNLIPAQTKRFQFEASVGLKVPHMGWSDVEPSKHPLFDGVVETPRYYFVHSYYVRCDSPQDSIARCDYGIQYDCAIGRGHVMGVQFHPEKSHRFGMQVFKNFLNNF